VEVVVVAIVVVIAVWVRLCVACNVHSKDKKGIIEACTGRRKSRKPGGGGGTVAVGVELIESEKRQNVAQ
jgi:hypothetical protein